MSTDKTKVKEKSSQERNFKKLSNVEHVRMRTGMWLGQNSASTFEQHFFRQEQRRKIRNRSRRIRRRSRQIEMFGRGLYERGG